MEMNIRFLDKAGGIGAFVSAMACPACFPLFSVLGSILGVGVLFPFDERTVIYIFMGFVVIALIGNSISFAHHRKLIPLLTGSLSALSIFFGIFLSYTAAFLYAGVIGLLVAAVLNFVESRRCEKCTVRIKNAPSS